MYRYGFHVGPFYIYISHISTLHYLDFDECVVSNGGCEQQCINRIPSFECRCDDGYTRDSDGFNCNGNFHYISQIQTVLICVELLVLTDFIKLYIVRIVPCCG